MRSTAFWGRREQLQEIQHFVDKPGAGFTFLRGRRRVGKSSVLQKVKREKKNCFYFMGAEDANDLNTRKNFADEWAKFSGENTLRELATPFLTWQRIFSAVTEYARRQPRKLILLIDEIQWLVKKGSGFIGKLKEAWLDWEQTDRVKILVCGSSNRFFLQSTQRGEQILRGIKTQASIWVPPFSLREVRKYFFPKWTLEEVCLASMMLGGIPYYLDALDKNKGFVSAMNDALFTRDTFFLEEIDEILGLEFNKRGMTSVKKILAVLGPHGATQTKVCKATGLSESAVSMIVEKLVDYGLLVEKNPFRATTKQNRAGSLYQMTDFFLNSYFQLLLPREKQIRTNARDLLFPKECLYSNAGFYIPNFTGKAFEALVQNILENYQDRSAPLFRILDLRDANYEVGSYWDQATQVDIIVEHKKDRISRVIECKWLSQAPTDLNAFIEEVLRKQYQPPKGYRKKHFLVLSQDVTKRAQKKAEEKGVTLVGLKALF